MISRPKKVNSVTVKQQIACGSLYITIGYVDEKPFEVFVRGGKSGGCISNQEAIGRLCSALLRNGLLEDVLDQLTGILCPACSRSRGESPKEQKDNIALSCPDAVARALKENLKERK